MERGLILMCIHLPPCLPSYRSFGHGFPYVALPCTTHLHLWERRLHNPSLPQPPILVGEHTGNSDLRGQVIPPCQL